MKLKQSVLFLFFLLGLSGSLYAQAWSGILDPSRATSWSWVPWTIPTYTVACTTQPSLTAGSGNAAANTTSINASIASCDLTHNVVNLASGTYYIAGIDWQKKSNVVVRGAGASSTYLYDTLPSTSCGGYTHAGFCMAGSAYSSGNSNVQPGASHACYWTGTNGTVGTYTQGATSLILNTCGSAPTLGTILTLDQADDGADTGGVFICDTYDSVVNCTQKGNTSPANCDGRLVSGTCYSEQWKAIVSGVSGSGSGPYTVTVSQGFPFNNVRSGQTPGAWWPDGIVTNDGIENLTLDHSTDTTSTIGGIIIWCNQCWYRNVRSIDGLTDHVYIVNDVQPQIRDSYFYGSQHAGSSSYCAQFDEVSSALFENNIVQNTTSPDIKDAVTGSVSGYNFTPYINFGVYMQGMYASHNSGSGFNLLEGNSTTSFIGDAVWGTSDLITIFRNQAVGWQPGYTEQTYPINLDAGVRGINIVGNVLGEPGYHTQYQAYATSTIAGVYQVTAGRATNSGAGTVDQSIYVLGWTNTGGRGVCTTPPVCDPLTFSTMMRWGNYDTVNAAVQWNSTESSPGAVTYINAQSTPATYTLPASFYQASKPAWFGSTPWPPIGPDVTSGNAGIFPSGTYSQVLCPAGLVAGGATCGASFGGYANMIPAENCYFNVMSGPPDGSGGVLPFDANNCYALSHPAPAPPTNPTASAH